MSSRIQGFIFDLVKTKSGWKQRKDQTLHNFGNKSGLSREVGFKDVNKHYLTVSREGGKDIDIHETEEIQNIELEYFSI